MMSSKIRVLDEHTINKIAAGEVIESPASVVKELVENSLDAKATEICVEIKGGGRQLIRVTDNGSGMNRDDAILCLERHATSKIKEVEDILSILTMGFRGEAIPSIASISKFTLLTCPRNATQGTLVIVDGGKLLQCEPVVHSPGTTIEVKSLFFNVPVRKKFQKSPAYDANEILKIMTVLALGNPHVKFQLIDNARTEIQTGTPSHPEFREQLKERIWTVMGSEFVAGCCFVDFVNGDYHLRGYVGLPSYARHNRSGQYLFINNRSVFSPFISYIVREAYGTTLATQKHPIFVLHLALPGDNLDVNVHPQKKEVRLRHETELKELLLKGIQQAIQQGNKECHSLFASSEEPSFIEQASPIVEQAHPKFNTLPTFSSLEREEKEWIKEYVSLDVIPQRTYDPRPPSSPSFIPPQAVEKRSFPRVLNTIPSYVILDALSLESWKAVPQDGLCLLDQKAAHARVIFENLLSNHQGQLAVQSLLIPYTLQLNAHEAAHLRMHLNKLQMSGIHIHESGSNSFMVDAIPTVFGHMDMSKLIIDLLDKLHEFPEENWAEAELERRLALSASYAAVSFGKRLQIEEAQSLVNRLFDCKTPFLCPQGKSTLSYIGPEELIKKFQKS